MRKTRILALCLMGSLTMGVTCVTVQDKKNRTEEINNTAQSLGELGLWKKIEKTKRIIDTTYQKMMALQDSIDQAKFKVNSILNLRMASIDEEILQTNKLSSDIDQYVTAVGQNQYSDLLKKMYLNKNAQKTAAELTALIYQAGDLPPDKAALQQTLEDQNNFKSSFEEFADKRTLQAANIYKEWSTLYQKKGAELSSRVMQDEQFSMTDFERIQTQRLARKYVVMSYEFLQKSDSLLLSVSKDHHNLKQQQINLLEKFLFTKQLFNP